MRSHAVTRFVFLVLALSAASATALAAHTSDDLFDSSALQEIRLFISARDLQQLVAHFDENTHYPVDLQWRDIRVRNASVRSRGTASRNPTKPGFEIDIDHYTTGQQFLGLRAIILDNLWQDPAMIREKVAMAFFNRMGEAAPRESFARLYINNTYRGVYAIVERIDAEFLTRRGADGSGYLFEYRNKGSFYGGSLGDELDPYKQRFEPRTHKLDADTILYSPIRDLFQEVSGPDDAVWRERVESFIDLEQFVRQVAIEMFLSEHDGLLGYAGMNNFYLYRATSRGQQRVLVWDLDLSFRDYDSSIFLRADENELFRRAMAYPDLHTLYLQKLEDCARSALEDDWLSNEIVSSAALIRDSALEDRVKPFSNDDFDSAVSWMKDFGRLRSAYVLEAVAGARRQ
jgi:spore coat protein CotH